MKLKKGFPVFYPVVITLINYFRSKLILISKNLKIKLL